MSKLILIILIILGFYVFINLGSSSQVDIKNTALGIPVKLGNILEQASNKIDQSGYEIGIGK